MQATTQMKRFAIDSRSDRGAYFSLGGYDLLLAPFVGYGERIEPLQAPLPKRTSQ
jgi:hypothetical protein